jgi:hypothetical protein
MVRLSGKGMRGRLAMLASFIITLLAASPSSAAASWHIVPSPNDGPSWIYGLGTDGSGEAWAVGNYYEHDYEPLAEHWDGSSWTIVETPETGSHSVLTDVAPLPSGEAWAVGYQGIGNAPTRTLILHWDGTSWTITRSPSPSEDPFYGENNLYGVAALPSGEAWAVGYRFTYRGYQALILHWGGSRWRVAPVPPASYRKLTSVVARSSDDVWAVGYEFTFRTGYQPMSLHWNGNRWRTVRPAQVTTGEAYLEGATVTPSGDIWAVGYQTVTGVPQPLFERWDGATWRIVPSPHLETKYNFLKSIEAVSDDDMWAAGYRTVGNRDVTFMEHWDGSRWTVVPTPDVPGSHNRLWDIAIDGSGGLWSGGYVFPRDNSPIKTLVLRRGTPGFADVSSERREV